MCAKIVVVEHRLTNNSWYDCIKFSLNPGIAKTFVSHLRENKQRASYTILFDNIPNRRRMAHYMIQSSV